MEVRYCRESDIDSVIALLGQLWPGEEPDLERLPGFLRELLSCQGFHMLCAVEDDRVVGFASLSVRQRIWNAGRFAYLDELVVDEAYRGRGIGAALVATVAEVASRAGALVLELDSATSREDAHRFYLGRGFRTVGVTFQLGLDPPP